MKCLIQKGLFYRNSFEIEDDGIMVQRNSPKFRNSYKVKFEDLGFNIQLEKKRNQNAFFVASLLFLLFQLHLIYGFYSENFSFTEVFAWTFVNLGLAAFILTVSYVDGKTYLFFTGGEKGLSIEKSNPNEAAVQDFIKVAKSSAKTYYLRMQRLNEPDLFNQPGIVNWLYRRGILNYNEMEEFRNTKEPKPIGFNLDSEDI